MRIKSIEVRNFKSLGQFRIELPKFCCLVGLNGSGKSTVLQCVDFLAQLARGHIDEWLEQRRWTSSEVLSKVRNFKTVLFRVLIVEDEPYSEVFWTGTYTAVDKRCTAEQWTVGDARLVVHDGKYTVENGLMAVEGFEASGTSQITFNYQGSIISQLRDDLLTPSIARVKQFLLGTESLEMLTPEYLRQRTREANGSLGHGGRNLSAFIHNLSGDDRAELVKQLREAYPRLQQIESGSIRAGWKKLTVVEQFEGGKLKTESRHVNDGMLRLIAILAELRSDHGLLLFDEIENGINPELVKFVVTALVNARQQVMATTHSPLILNYLDDEVARQSVVLLYKAATGNTRSIRLFDVPSLAEKLKYMGAGEAFVDTDLTALSAEIAGRPAGV